MREDVNHANKRLSCRRRTMHAPCVNWNLHNTAKHSRNTKLECLVIYGRASSEQCARGSSALNTWSKVWPWILIWAYLIWNFEPIFGQQISIVYPPYIGLFGPSWSELSPYGWIAGAGVGWAGDIFFVTDRQKRDYLSLASQRARGATNMWPLNHWTSANASMNICDRSRLHINFY